jgi:DNA polymerase I-like protein with 3'-5' exonuclease and polymerase domains
MPPGGSVSIWAKFNTQGRFIGSRQFDEYREILIGELADVSANVVVPLGAIPYYAITGLGSPGIMKRRGSIVEASPDFGGRKVVGTIHPSAVDRGLFKAKHYITMDMARIKGESAFPEFRFPERTMHIEPSYSAAIEYIDNIYSTGAPFGFDIEVVNEELACFALAKAWNDVMCIPLIGQGPYFSEIQEREILLHLARLLGDTNLPVIGQNMIFDMSFMHNRYGIITRNFHDTFIAQGIVSPDFPKGLDFLCSIFTKIPYYKDEGKMWSDFLGDIRTFYQYNCKDAAAVMEIFPKLMRHIKRQGNMETYRAQLDTVHALMYMGLRGMRCDAEYKNDELKRGLTEVAGLEAQWNGLTGGSVDPNSPKQLMKYFYETRGFKKIYEGRGDKKTVTTNADAIKEIAKRHKCKEAYVLRDHRTVSKYVNSYLKMKLDRRGRLITAINPVGTKNGRISSNKDPIDKVGGNLQTLPHRFRRCVMADQGNILFEMDISMGENRCVAYFAPDWNMIKAFESGIDLHKQTAALIFFVPYDEVTTDDFTCPLGDGTHSQRFWGKKANHGLNYGEGYKKFARINELLEREAKMIVERYHRAYPGVRQYQEWTESYLRQNKCTMRNPFGRLRTFHDKFGQQMLNSAFNFLPQSTIADVINRWGLNHYYNNSHPGQTFEWCEMLMQVHDSLLFQIPLHTGWPYIAQCVCNLRDSLQQRITWQGRSWSLPVDLNMGFNAGAHQGKRNKDNYNPLGMLDVSCKGTVEEVAANLSATYLKLAA